MHVLLIVCFNEYDESQFNLDLAFLEFITYLGT